MLPFFVLLVFVGMVGTILITARATTATVAAFEGTLLRASLLSNDHLAVLEAERLAQLRAAIDTQGVAAAVAGADTSTLARLLRPIQANAVPSQLVIRVLDAKGNEELVLTPAGGPQAAGPLSNEPTVIAVLAGHTDARGDKYVFPRSEPSGIMLYWVGPVHSDQHTVVGAVVLGEPLTEIAGSIRDSRASDLIFYDQSGRVLLSSLKGVPPLSQTILGQLPNRPVRVSQTLDGHRYEFLVATWNLRTSSIGYIAAALEGESLVASVTQIRLLMLVLFAVGSLTTLLFGTIVAKRITRPVEQLVASTAAIAAGNWRHRATVASNDEIGVLASAFNVMTDTLEQKAREVEETYFASIESLARAIDARDPYTFGHSTRVAAISLEIADEIGLPAEERTALRRAALLHDIGKIGVEDSILRKKGPLTDEEWNAMREHPLIGYKMLLGLNFLKPSLSGVLHHHERWDGKGYPAGLKDDAITPYVRILTVADTFDAMTSDRPYRSGLPYERALAEIRRFGGTQFDPAVVDAFIARASQISILLTEKSALGQQDVTSLERAA
ncbi:MAG: HD domain-containing phosphohydrolase [Candidatus Dormibacter sp.]